MIATSPARTSRTPSPNQRALALTGRDYLSPSAISSYQRCPLQFRFRYIDNLEPEFTSSSLVFGGSIHSAIEHHFRLLFEGRPAPSVDELVGVYDDAWTARSDTPVRLGKSETVETLRNLARRMLTAFQVSELSKLDGRLLGVEEELRGSVVPGCPDVLGRVDLLVHDHDSVQIIDFKTSRSRWSEFDVELASAQQLLYAELVAPLAEALGDLRVEISWIVLTKTKSPSVERHTLTPDAKQVARTKLIVRRVWDAIEGGNFHPSPSAMSCSTCAFRNACRAWEG